MNSITKRRTLMMIADSFYIPKHNISKPRGEDAHFLSHDSQVIGVSDGVGGWARKGIDAGEYARELMLNAAYALDDLDPDNVDPKEVLIKAYLNTEAKGSATACIITLAGDNILRAANLGDSGFCVIRAGKTFYKSPVQQHRFNYPYQMGRSCGTSPEEAEEIAVAVESGDVIIVGTDGLFDNVFPEDIEAAVELCLEDEKSPEILAWTLARAALVKSLETTTASPFEVAAYEAGIEHFGGKYDDITVVVAFVSPY
ncbi:hypothetical protein BUALT_Bualt12G0025400 [Buddleja alternifolia]|uniref:Protein phosphatase n=1 Tax=Buddleja alternifolia TaxID=168488 RepID=A0AAV6WLY2_9LAMI|nr:hypothetical protein BUALT_Bualt12G0025400 [Buddleja alternifolia]